MIELGPYALSQTHVSLPNGIKTVCLALGVPALPKDCKLTGLLGQRLIHCLKCNGKEVYNSGNFEKWLDLTITSDKRYGLDCMFGRGLDTSKAARIYIPFPDKYVDEALHQRRMPGFPMKTVDYGSATLDIEFTPLSELITGTIDESDFSYKIVCT